MLQKPNMGSKTFLLFRFQLNLYILIRGSQTYSPVCSDSLVWCYIHLIAIFFSYSQNHHRVEGMTKVYLV